MTGILYLSRPIIDTKADYYRLLLAVTAQDAWEDWLLYMIDAVRGAAVATRNTIASISQAKEDFVGDHRAVTPGMDNAAFQQVLFTQPYVRTTTVVQGCSVSRQTAPGWLHALSDVGALQEVKKGRDVLFLNTAFLAALTP